MCVWGMGGVMCLCVWGSILVHRDMTGGPLDLCSRRYLLANNRSIASKVLECIHTPIGK